MPASYQQQDTTWGEEPAEELDEHRPAVLGAILTGVLALLGGGLLAGAPFLDFAGFGGETQTEVDGIAFPESAFYVGVASLAAAAGLLALLLPRHRLGTAAIGAVVVPAAAVGGFQLVQLLTLYDRLDRDNQSLSDVAELGLWLVLAGAVLVTLAAVVGLLTAMSRARPSRGTALPLLGVLGVVGLLQWWVVAPVWRDEGGTFIPALTYIDDGARDTWTGVASISMLGLMLGAVALAAARTGAAAVGVALGAALAVGVELAARFMVDKDDLLETLVGELRDVPTYLTGATAGVLLLLAVALGISASNNPELQTADAAEAWGAGYTPAAGATTSWGQSGTQDPWSAGEDTSTRNWSDDAGTSWKRDEDAGQSGQSWASDDESTTGGSSYPGQSTWPST